MIQGKVNVEFQSTITSPTLNVQVQEADAHPVLADNGINTTAILILEEFLE
jgi:hypothetical protein